MTYVSSALPPLNLDTVKHKVNGCTVAGGNGRSGCGMQTERGSLAPDIWAKIKNHPCYSEQAHHHFARMHVAVAPACNIQCNYCNRKYDCANESRPGVTSERLTPEQAAHKVLLVATEIPQLSVVGIAGPGDALATPEYTFKTFELVSRAAPDIRLCLSTNGLTLPDHIARLREYNVEHVTITINMIDPEIGSEIYPWIYFNRKRYFGREAARILHERQMEGVERLAEAKILCKVNSVLIPGINDEHLIQVNRAVKEKGAFLHNIMPLISSAEHGTVFGLHGHRSPTPQELKRLQDDCEGGINIMRHCRQCRADAVGLLGKDRSVEFSKDKIGSMEVKYDPRVHRQHHERIEISSCAHNLALHGALLANTGLDEAKPILVAVATSGGGKINVHFGHAEEFLVYEISNKLLRLVGHRRVERYCVGGYGEDDNLDDIIRAITDCKAVFIAKIGICPRKTLSKNNIEVVDQFAFEYIESSLLAYYDEYSHRLSQ